MIFILILCFTTLQIHCQLLSPENQNVYVARTSSSLRRPFNDDDDDEPNQGGDESKRGDDTKRKHEVLERGDDDLEDILDDQEEDADVDSHRIRVRQYNEFENEQVRLQLENIKLQEMSYRPTQKILLMLTSTPPMKKMQQLQTRLLFDYREPWPTITLKMMKDLTPPTLMTAPTRSKVTWRDYFPPTRSVSRDNATRTLIIHLTPPKQTIQFLDALQEILEPISEYNETAASLTTKPYNITQMILRTTTPSTRTESIYGMHDLFEPLKEYSRINEVTTKYSNVDFVKTPSEPTPSSGGYSVSEINDTTVRLVSKPTLTRPDWNNPLRRYKGQLTEKMLVDSTKGSTEVGQSLLQLKDEGSIVTIETSVKNLQTTTAIGVVDGNIEDISQNTTAKCVTSNENKVAGGESNTEKTELKVALKTTDVLPATYTLSVTTTVKQTVKKQIGRKGTQNMRAAKKPKWLCYTCGLNETKFASDQCYSIFQDRALRKKYRMRGFQTDCNKNANSKEYFGGCFHRFLDVGVEYNERGCRMWPPTRGKSFVSKQLMKLEYLLKYETEGCVASPHAILVPFSRSVYLYARFHVCVCEGRFCNDANVDVPTSVLIVFILIVTINNSS